MNKDKRIKRVMTLIAILAISGCATLPIGPTVRVLPGDGKAFEQFREDDAVCRQWAAQSIGMSPQETAGRSVVSGAVVGTAIGAGAGALIGAAAGNPGAGAAIGAGSGLLLGTAAGADAGQLYGMHAQRYYDNTYIQCMYAKGNQVPWTGRRYNRNRGTSLPPSNRNMVPPDYVPDNSPPLTTPP
jgi:hypothetical protein